MMFIISPLIISTFCMLITHGSSLFDGTERFQMGSKQKSQSPPKLDFVFMIWRHGDRAPEKLFPNKNANDELFANGYDAVFSVPLGELTEEGKQQERQLGKRIRSRYTKVLGLNGSNVYVRSTNVSRTIESARSVLDGMGLPDHYIDVPSQMKFDSAGNPFRSCPRVTKDLDGRDTKVLRKRFKKIYEVIRRKTGFNGTVYAAFNIIQCAMFHHVDPPKWSVGLLKKMNFIRWLSLEYSFGVGAFPNEDYLRSKTGGILNNVVNAIEDKIYCTGPNEVNNCSLKFYGLSAHDITIFATISPFPNYRLLLGYPADINYGANIAFELYSDSNKGQLIKVMYANGYNEKPVTITDRYPGCKGEYCDVDIFLSGLNNIIIGDMDSFCKLRRQERAIEENGYDRYFNGVLADVMVL
ncbi:hypothetical protein AB6A40_005667 [Gnathostoma spinigerum]|uniref:2-phosphoxylose phosphatase 1 n=1 Tax=Gnathostoma spinigerum TaxID=75299 RepID=A0ABD6EPN3_9BILA